MIFLSLGALTSTYNGQMQTNLTDVDRTTCISPKKHVDFNLKNNTSYEFKVFIESNVICDELLIGYYLKRVNCPNHAVEKCKFVSSAPAISNLKSCKFRCKCKYSSCSFVMINDFAAQWKVCEIITDSLTIA